ncbi:MAG: hypothetical protein KDC53_21705 [Saprospiraceae bacterium]|nr:hypothetical protein [Saprospiraceae bacterium]
MNFCDRQGVKHSDCRSYNEYLRRSMVQKVARICHKNSWVCLPVIIVAVFLIAICSNAMAYQDEIHYSETFGAFRTFRVFTPLAYNPVDETTKYPVIYFFHGCGGSYARSGPYKYVDYGLKPVPALNRPESKDYEYANNADFENVATDLNVIIIAVDGHIAELPEGCQVYFPTLAESWDGNYYNFSRYIRELIAVVDQRYQTKQGAQYRAVSGLSMGGHMASWIAATNPHLFSSASQFCYGPNYYDVGDPAFQTTVDIRELWRNLRTLPFRHTTTDRDYLRFYTDYLYATFRGAGFENEYYLADHCHHAAARVDLQFAFHMSHFIDEKQNPSCFSHINLYPDFEVWGYDISSGKTGNGWIYVHDVSKDGLGLYTRKRLPWGQSLGEFEIKVITPGIYQPSSDYVISRYSYKSDTISIENITSDQDGKIIISSGGGAGEEIGIIGDGIQPPIFVLTDTVNENIYLEDGRETVLSGEIVNLSLKPQTVDFHLSSENEDVLNILSNTNRLTIPALTKIKVDSFFMVQGKYLSAEPNIAYLQIHASIDGVALDRVQYRQVHVKSAQLQLDVTRVRIFDGLSDSLPVFKYNWGSWDPLKKDLIKEGKGNGNGVIETGETFAIWIQPEQAFDSLDQNTWHSTIPINNAGNTDIEIKEIIPHHFTTGKSVLSAQMRLFRSPTPDHPIRIPLRTEFLKMEPLTNDCHRPTADNFQYAFVTLILNADGTIEIE